MAQTLKQKKYIYEFLKNYSQKTISCHNPARPVCDGEHSRTWVKDGKMFATSVSTNDLESIEYGKFLETSSQVNVNVVE